MNLSKNKDTKKEQRHSTMNLKHILFFCLITIWSMESLEAKCQLEEEIISELDDKCYYVGTRGPCAENQWIVLKGRRGVCQQIKCQEDEVLYKRKCQNMFANEACPVGERLYLTLEGKGRCGCKEGWMRKYPQPFCYQQFTRGFCEGGKILKIKYDKKTEELIISKASVGFIFPSELEEIKKKKTLVCIDNPCSEGTLPHTDTWGGNQTCHKVVKEVLEKDDCEVEVGSVDGTLVCNKGSGMGEIVPFSLAPVFQGRKCRRGRVWSKYRKRCVRTYKG